MEGTIFVHNVQCSTNVHQLKIIKSGQQLDDHDHSEQQPNGHDPPTHIIVHGGHSFNRNILTRHHHCNICKY